MIDAVMSPSLESSIEVFLKRPGQSLLIEGQPGSGRRFIAQLMAEELIGEKLTPGVNVKMIEPGDTDKILIADVRSIDSFLKLKSVARRAVLVIDADKMVFAAQNSFLKLLEEPPDDCFLILTGQAGGLKSTILSRVQKIHVEPISRERALSFFGEHEQTEWAWRASGGLIGQMSSLIRQGTDSPLKNASDSARQLLSASRFDRLVLVDSLARDKEASKSVVDVLVQMSSQAMAAAGREDQIEKWLRIESLSLDAERQLASNANPKLALMNLALNL